MTDFTVFFISDTSKRLLGRPFLDIRGEYVHGEDGEGHALGVGAELADDKGYHAAADREHDSAGVIDGSGDIVGRHEDRAEEHAACHDGIKRGDEASGGDKGEDEHRADKGGGNVPLDDTARAEIRVADEQGEDAALTDSAAAQAEEHIHQRGELLGTGRDELQRGSGGLKLHNSRHSAACDFGEGKQHEHTAADGGVCEVVPKPAEEALDDDYREGRANDALPDGDARAEVQPKQKPGDDGAEVAHGLLSVGRKIEQRFGNDSTDDAGGDDLKRAGAEDHDGGDGGREQRDDDIEHHAAAGIRGMNMRGVRYDQLIHITFPLLFRPERPCIF